MRLNNSTLIKNINNASIVATIHLTYWSTNKYQQKLNPMANKMAFTDRILNRLDLADQLEKFKIINNYKSILLSALVVNKQITTLKRNLLIYAKRLIQQDFTHEWQIKLLITPCGEFSLINIFLTNNFAPQLINLGYDCACELVEIASCNQVAINNCNNYDLNFSQTNLANLCKLTYYWQLDHPSNYYHQFIQVIDQDWPTYAQLLDKHFKIRFDYLLAHDYCAQNLIPKSTSDHRHDTNVTILYLDLNWLFDNLITYNESQSPMALTNEIPVIKKVIKKMIS